MDRENMIAFINKKLEGASDENIYLIMIFVDHYLRKSDNK